MPRAKSNSTAQASYAELRHKLDLLVTQLQDPDCDVDQAAEVYVQAMAAIRELETHVQAAENKVRMVQITQTDANADGMVD